MTKLLLVTIKLPRNPNHNPHAKVTAPCAVSAMCSDMTGEHHTLVAKDWNDVLDIRAKYGHITRVEELEIEL